MKLKMNKFFTKKKIRNKKNKDQIEKKITYYKFVLNDEIKDK
jgi:hypothetical protein